MKLLISPRVAHGSAADLSAVLDAVAAVVGQEVVKTITDFETTMEGVKRHLARQLALHEPWASSYNLIWIAPDKLAEGWTGIADKRLRSCDRSICYDDADRDMVAESAD